MNMTQNAYQKSSTQASLRLNQKVSTAISQILPNLGKQLPGLPGLSREMGNRKLHKLKILTFPPSTLIFNLVVAIRHEQARIGELVQLCGLVASCTSRHFYITISASNVVRRLCSVFVRLAARIWYIELDGL